RGDAALFVSVTVCGALTVAICWLANVNAEGESPGAVNPAPVPVRLTVCGLPDALSVTVTDADSGPIAAGAKRMPKVQLVDAARVDPQVFAVSVQPVPTAMPVIPSG